MLYWSKMMMEVGVGKVKGGVGKVKGGVGKVKGGVGKVKGGVGKGKLLFQITCMDRHTTLEEFG